jgi:SAM-dependent methyltransferase
VDTALHEHLVVMGQRHWWYRARRTIVAAVLRERLAANDHRRVLEVGAGTGSVTVILGEFGEVTAVEPHPSALAACRAAAPFADVLQGDIEAMPRLPEIAPASFDLVCAFDVIEHLQDDVAALRQLRLLIAEGGQLVLTVPALELLWGGHDDVNGHYRRYSRTQLERHLRLAGYEVEFVSYFSALLFPVVAAVRVGRRLLREEAPEPNSDFKLSVRPVNALLTRLFALEARVVARHRLPIGSSLVAVARPV